MLEAQEEGAGVFEILVGSHGSAPSCASCTSCEKSNGKKKGLESRQMS